MVREVDEARAFSERTVAEGRLVLAPLPLGPGDWLAGFPEEKALVGEDAALARRQAFEGGRAALRRALAHFGIPPLPIVKDERGAPVMPSGFVGSISHKTELAVAIANPFDGFTLGIDVEVVKAPKGDIAPRILREEERAEVELLLPEERVRGLLVRFALKEAVYKAIDPFVRRYVDYRDCAVLYGAASEARITLFLRPGEPALDCTARFFDEGQHVVAIARARVRS